MTKQEQIKEMARIIRNSHIECPLDKDGKHYVVCGNCRYDVCFCTETQKAEALINAGYGNVKEVVKEFAERVKMAFYYEFDELIPSIMSDKIDALIKEVCGEQTKTDK